MKALMQNSLENVREALILDPDAARFPFFDHQVKPPLCLALECKCNAEIVRLLLKYGADPDIKDLRGRGPRDILRSIRTAPHDPVLYIDLDLIEQVLGAERLVRRRAPQQTGAPVSAPELALHEDFLFNACFDYPPGHLPPWAALGNQLAMANLPPKLHAAL
jgi:hypothetical protein